MVLRLKFCILAAALVDTVAVAASDAVDTVAVDTVAACDAVDTVAVAACDGALMVMGRPVRLPTMPRIFLGFIFLHLLRIFAL